MIDTTQQTKRGPGPCRLFVGTSGYSYTEWVDAGFYPPDTKSGRMLPLYARHFPITELNYTWYQMPRADAIERQRQLVPPEFLFAAKLTRNLTHEIDPEQWPGHADRYRNGVTPLLQADQLVAVLIQLPPSFSRTPNNRKYLAALIDKLHGLPLAIEFRHRSWANDHVFTELERRRVTLVAVDEPNLPGLFEEKIVHMGKRARRGVLFFNNHVRAQAPENARRMTGLLKEQGLTVVELQ